MKRTILAAVLLMPLLVNGIPRPAQAAETGVSIRVGDRYQGTNLRFTTRPRMTVVPKTKVYYVKDSDRDVYRYGRYYYGFDQGRWYRASSYRGPWIYVRGRTVPRSIYSVPADYRKSWQGDYNYWQSRDYDEGWEQYRGNGVNRDGSMTPASTTPASGNTSPGSNNRLPGPGTTTPGSGTTTPGSGTTTPGSGTTTPGSGTNKNTGGY